MDTFSIDLFLIISALLGGIIYLLIYHIKRLDLYKKASAFDGPRALPVLGNALHFLGNTEDIFKKIADLSALYSTPYRVWLGPQLLILISEPEYIKKVLYSDKMVEKSHVYRFFRPWLGNGLFSAPAAQWRVHRKLIGPTFNLKLLKSFVDVFASKAEKMVKNMEVELNGTEFEIFKYLSQCTLDIICETAMGVSMDDRSTSGYEYAEAAETAFAIAYKRVYKAWLHPDVIFNRTQLGKDQQKCIKVLHSFTDAVIRKKRAALLNRNHQKSTVDSEEDMCNPTGPRTVYLDRLITLSDGERTFSDTELREEVDTMMVAGNDTASNVICFVMLMLASHSDVQEKTYQELSEIYADRAIDDCKVTPEDLPRMEYMDRVIKETLRLFPIAPLIGRTAMDDLTIGEYTLPKGSMVGVEIFTVHRSEKYWHEPLKFDPDRFLPEEIEKRPTYCYLPYSAGPRNCIGSRFAVMEIKTILATVLQRYILKKDNIIPISEIKLRSDAVLKSADPITLRIERRPSKLGQIQSCFIRADDPCIKYGGYNTIN